MFIVGSAESNRFFLFIGQEEIALLGFSVTALACLTAQYIDTGIRVAGFHMIHRDLRSCGSTEVLKKHLHNGIGLENIHTLALLDLIFRSSFYIVILEFIDPLLCCDRKTTVLQTFQNGDAMALVDLTGTGAAFDRHGCSGAVEGHFLGFQG